MLHRGEQEALPLERRVRLFGAPAVDATSGVRAREREAMRMVEEYYHRLMRHNGMRGRGMIGPAG